MVNLRVSNYNFKNQFKKNCSDVYEKACDITKGITNKVKSLFPEKLPGKTYVPEHKKSTFLQSQKIKKRNSFFKVLVGMLGVLGISLGIYLNRNCIAEPPIQSEPIDPSTEEEPPSEEPQTSADEKKYDNATLFL